jgi:hypothetical protein
MMKKLIFVFLASSFLTAGVAFAASELAREFFRRDSIRLTQEQGNAINFLKSLKFPVEKIEELEILDENGSFVLRDRENVICLGNPTERMLRCKNRAGITTVLYEGDAD